MPRGIRNITAGSEVSSRAAEVRQERRKQPGMTTHTGTKLNVDERALDRKTYHYRFVNDRPGRMQQLMADDYDPAPELGAKPDSNSLGTVSSTVAGVEDGKPYNAVLMRKRKDWYEADQAEKQKPIDAMDEAIRRGNTAAQVNPHVAQLGDGAYTPNGVNIIERA